MAKTAPSSPKKEGNVQIASREEVDIYENDEEPIYYDFEEDDGAGTSTTVKISERPLRPHDRPSNSGWQISNTPPVREPSPPKPVVGHARSTSQISTPSQPRYVKSDVPARSSATSSTAVSPTIQQAPAFSSNMPRSTEYKPKSPRKVDALEDILLPALDAVDPLSIPKLINSVLALQRIVQQSVSCVSHSRK
jgi:hypothetical protein